MEPSESPADDFQRESATLRRIARGILLEPALAEDAVQEAWLAALRAGPPAVASGGWLNQAVRRIAHGLRRREARQARRERAGARAEGLPSAADTAARLELLRELLDALRELDEPYRTAVQMRLVDDLPPREIAERTGVPVETARTRVKRGVERLRAKLDARHAGRRDAFLGLLAPLAGFDPSSAVLSTVLGGKAIGGTIMGVQAKVCVAAVLVAAAGVLLWRPWTAASAIATDADVVAQPESVLGATAASESVAQGELARELQGAREELTGARADVAGTPRGTWVVRGKVLDVQKRPIAGIDVRVRVVAGYEGDGEELGSEVARSADAGSFAFAFEPPTSAVRVIADVVSARHIDFRREELVLRGAPAPQDLILTCYPSDVTLRGRVVDPALRPVAAAHVRSHADAVVTDAEGRFEARTSSSFRESFVTAWSDGFAERRISVQVTEPEQVIEDIEIVLRAEGVLRGRVVDESGRAVPGAELECFALEHVRATSGPGGRFELRGLPLDENWLGVGVSAAGFARKRVDLEDGRIPAEELEVVLQRGIDIAGVVVDQSGGALPGAMVCFGKSQFDVASVKCVAGDDGRFVLRDVARVKGSLFAEAKELAMHVEPLDVSAGPPPMSLRIVMHSGGTIAGRIVDERGAALAGMRISLRTREDYLDSSASTDEAGNFRLNNVPEREGLQLECYGARRVRTTVDVSCGASLILIVMPPAAAFAGRVTDARTGEPITSFRVRFVSAELRPGDESLSGIGASWVVEGHEVRDADGRWSTVGEELREGMVTGVEVTAAGYGPGIVARAEATLNPEATPIEIALSVPVRVSGRVVDARTGLAIVDARVRRIAVRQTTGGYYSGSDSEAARTTSDARGEFVFAELSTEPMWLVVEAQGFAPVVDGPFEPGPVPTHRHIELDRGATLRGVLRDANDAALAGETVRVNAMSSVTNEHRDWRLVTDAEGRFEVGDLAPGSYQVARELRFESGGVFDLSRTVEVRDANVYEVELHPTGACRIEGVVQATGRPFIGFVSARREDADASAAGNARSAFVVEGKFTLEGLPPGRWQLTVHELKHVGTARNGSLVVEIVDGAPTNVRIDVAER